MEFELKEGHKFRNNLAPSRNLEIIAITNSPNEAKPNDFLTVKPYGEVKFSFKAIEKIKEEEEIVIYESLPEKEGFVVTKASFVKLINSGNISFIANTEKIVNMHKKEKVNHPEHYQGKIECIDYIESLGNIAEGFCLGNAVKYIHRYLQKTSNIEDLEKARWYLNRAIEKHEKIDN